MNLYALAGNGKDRLGNPLYQPTLLVEALGRFTEWSKEELKLLGYEAVKNQRKCLTFAEGEFCNRASSLRFKGEVFHINAVKDLGKYRLLYLTNYKGEGHES